MHFSFSLKQEEEAKEIEDFILEKIKMVLCSFVKHKNCSSQVGSGTLVVRFLFEFKHPEKKLSNLISREETK